MKFLLYSLAPLYFIEVAHIHATCLNIETYVVFFMGALPSVVGP